MKSTDEFQEFVGAGPDAPMWQERLPPVPKSRRGGWTSTKEKLLRLYYETKSLQELSELLGHSVEAIYKRAWKLDLKRPNRPKGIEGGYKAKTVNRRTYSFRRYCRPPHCRELEEGSIEWYRAQNDAFIRAMLEAGYKECRGQTSLNNCGSTR